MALPYSGEVRRWASIAAGCLAAFAGCSGDDPAKPVATQPATATQTEQPGDAGRAARGPVRLLLLGRFDQPTYITSPRGDSRRFVVEREGTIRVVKGRRVL